MRWRKSWTLAKPIKVIVKSVKEKGLGIFSAPHSKTIKSKVVLMQSKEGMNLPYQAASTM